ncbi:hypothetical protein [Bifidobacterium callitrichidarum]|uniref:Uncharacterized protein n=1 Tax=Bifidobacterium callitrichidarum TaxID=2052941 RepID=A0A2U2NCB4_9BIFI|nr:hypothetical protein [Bifidobacterium callitrichidarum]PWG66728.1 hypothetical protein DF196_02160 [Bifidobacterium callitrichidarum]
MADFPWNNFRNDSAQPQPVEPQVAEPAEPQFDDQDGNVDDVNQYENDETVNVDSENVADETETESDSEESVEETEDEKQDDNGETEDADDEQDEAESDEDDDESDEETETATAETPASGRGHRVKKNGTVPTFDRWAAKKLIDCLNTLNTESGAAAAKTILGAGTADPATLLAQLSEKKNRKRVNEVAAQVKELTGSDDTSVLMMNLALAFSADKDLAKSMMGLFNAVAPEKDFGRSTGDPRKDAKNVASKWGDGVDLSVISTLAL